MRNPTKKEIETVVSKLRCRDETAEELDKAKKREQIARSEFVAYMTRLQVSCDVPFEAMFDKDRGIWVSGNGQPLLLPDKSK